MRPRVCAPHKLMTTSDYERCLAFIECHVKPSGLTADAARHEPPPAITVSRQTGTRGRSICEKLVLYLQQRDTQAQCPWTLFDKNLLHTILKDHHLPSELAEYMPEDRDPLLQGVIGEILGLHPSLWTLFQKTTKTVWNLCRMGNSVIVGRGGAALAGTLPNVFHFRFVGSPENRIQRVLELSRLESSQAEAALRNEHDAMSRNLRTHFADRRRPEELTAKEATEFIREEDAARARYLRSHFSRDIDDPRLYDAVINTDSLDDTTVVAAIGDLVLRQRCKSGH